MPTYRNCLESFKDDLQLFRKWMRRHQQPGFDRVFVHARFHADSAGTVSPTDPELAAVFSMCVGLQLEIMQLRRELGMDATPPPGTLLSEGEEDVGSEVS